MGFFWHIFWNKTLWLFHTKPPLLFLMTLFCFALVFYCNFHLLKTARQCFSLKLNQNSSPYLELLSFWLGLMNCGGKKNNSLVFIDSWLLMNQKPFIWTAGFCQSTLSNLQCRRHGWHGRVDENICWAILLLQKKGSNFPGKVSRVDA